MTDQTTIDVVLDKWSILPPTDDDFKQCGATLIRYERSNYHFAGDYHINGKPDVFTNYSMQVNYDSTIVDHRCLTNITDKRVDAQWASTLYVVRYNGTRFANILRVRKTNALIVFNVSGEPVKVIPTRKHVKPNYIKKQFGINTDVNITIDCIQLDAIRQSKFYKGNENYKAPNQLRRVNYTYNKPANIIDDESVLESMHEVVNGYYKFFYRSTHHKTDTEALSHLGKI